MKTEIKNIFADLPDATHAECFNLLTSGKNLRIERIVSCGQITEEDYWYDQEQNEWVMVLQGSAHLLFEDGNRTCCMSQGDYLLIPAHCRHRVAWTDPQRETIWLAIHFDAA